MARLLVCVAVVGALISAAGCGETPTAPAPAPVSIRIDGAALVIEAGQSIQLTALPLDAEGAEMPNVAVTFASDRPDVASVDATGMVAGVSPGVAEIAAAAGNARAVATVSVRPRGSLTVAQFALAVEPDFLGQRVLRLETWSLWPQSLAFTARNASGESICQMARLAITVADSAVLGAVQRSAYLEPCAVVLEARRPGSTWLKVAAGSVADSVWVDVIDTDLRFAFGSAYPDQSPLTAGTPVRFDLAVARADGGSVSGIPVTFEVHSSGPCCPDTPAQVSQQVTDDEGYASLEATTPTSTLSRSTSFRGFFTSTWPVLAVRVRADIASTAPFVALEYHPVVPAAPARIAVWVQRWRTSPSATWYAWVEARGDTVQAGDWSNPACTWAKQEWYGSWAAAAAVDRYGNPVASPPAGTAANGEITTRVAPYVASETTTRVAIYDQRVVTQYPGSTRVEVTTVPPFSTATITFSYPGLPSRTIYLSVGSIPC